MQPEQHEIVVDIKSFITGETRVYKFVPLKRKQAAKVFHNTLFAILSTLSGVSSNKDSLSSALNNLDFDTFWSLAEDLLQFVIIDNEEIDINDTDYFEDKPEELYLAVYHAVIKNWPGVFGKIQEVMKDSNFLKKLIKGLVK